MHVQQLLAMHHHTFITHAVEIELNAWTRCHGYICTTAMLTKFLNIQANKL